jgi:UDP-N-acetylmuramoyl-L-alanyl-D-glutamate--2,6-diaminopimelate ligase
VGAVTLEELARVLEAERQGQAVVRGLAYDSRRVREGDLFCAVRGFTTDGHRYIDDARRRGAVACLVEDVQAVPPDFPWLLVRHSRIAMADAAAYFYGYPSHRLWMVGVTGTNGKTTTTHLIREILEACGVPTGLTGTVHTLVGTAEWPVVHTTPEAPDLQATLRQMVDAGMAACVMEVSSHALALERVRGTAYDVGVFTNLTQDHLDFHRDFEAYFAAKARLFERLGDGPDKGPRGAVLNADDAWAARLAGLTRVPIVTYGIESPADVTARAVRLSDRGARFILTTPRGEAPVEMPLAGRFNVANALAAAAVGHLFGCEPEAMAEALARTAGVPGRFERVDCGQPFTVVVDYAHSPDGLENVLKTARELATGRVLVVFGAGGDRDRGKRPQMGAVAARWADMVVVTSDNPRSEDPEAILQDIAAGLKGSATPYHLVADRREAIRLVIGEAEPGDLVVIAGKGHETYQIFRDRTVPFDDREEARAALEARGYRRTP